MSNTAAPVLSPRQHAALEFLCAGGRSYMAPLRTATGAGPNTLTSLVGLGLVTTTTAGARGTLYHLTDSGRTLACAATDPETEGGPTMNMTELTDAPTALEDAPAVEEPSDAPADTPAPAKRRRGKKDAELANVAATDPAPDAPAAPAAKKATGPTPEMTALYKDVVKQIKALTRGAKTVEKAKYLRIGDAKGKTIAYVNFATSKSVLVEVPKPKGESGYVTVSVKTADDVPAAVAATQAFITARDAAQEAAA